MNKEVKLKAIHTYQYVVFAGKNHQFMTDNLQLGLVGLELTYLPELMAVRVKNTKDDILVFCTNIAYARPMTEENAKVTETPRAKLKDIDPAKAVK